jgi:hypothetical protein
MDDMLDTSMNALLLDGPASFPEDRRRLRVPTGLDKVKVPHHAGYEHFERDAAADEPGLLAFRWSGRTAVAE